ncbi:MAG: hypothetical protein LBL90_09710 [Prevotellaceae bacterium]|nr:hypothetical protein [Prevotellaceae bacterium]
MNTKYLRFILGAAALFSVILPIQAQAQSTPGGITANFKVWLTPDKYNNGSWINNITGTGSAGNFVESTVSSHAAPGKVNGFNYHQAAYFSKEANSNAYNRLISANTMTLSQGNNVTAIFVYEREDDQKYDYLFSFNNGDTNCDLAFYTDDDNDLRLFWESPSRGTVASTQGKGIVAVSIANNSASATALGYVDGKVQSTTGNWLGSSGISSKWTIGANGSAADFGYGFEGNIQEVIILNAGGTNNHIAAADLHKIHTYLAIKYGIRLDNSDNYELYAADGASRLTLWNRDLAFDKNIFGIGRDDASMLNQVQSRSATNAGITVFVGDLAGLNDQNPAFAAKNELNDKQFLILGSDGASESIGSIKIGTQYVNGIIGVSPLITSMDLNVVGAKYKAQLTNATSMTVNFQTSNYSFCFVSTSPDFNPATTKAYPLANDGIIHDVEIDGTYKYIRFADMRIGPGGMPLGLKMWLRADDPNSLTLVPGMDLADYTTSTSIAWRGLNAPSAIQTGVTQWRDTDPTRTTVYSKNGSNMSIRTPVYIPAHYLMNYHPAIDFYTNWSSLSAFLSTTKGPMSTGRPANSTTFLVMNSALRTGDNDAANTYMMSFHNPEVLTSYTDYKPGLGIRGVKGDGQPRLRVNGAVNIDKQLFNPGSTTVTSYQLTNVGGSIPANNIVVGFNMQYGIYGSSQSVSTWYMNGKGSLGGSRYHTRSMKGLISEVVMYEKALNNNEMTLVNSYYALKYGLTLRPNSSDYPAPRFDYKLSNGTSIWPGLSSATGSTYIRYYHNIAAIIRDDAALLNNTQAHSTEVGSILHVGVAGKSLNFDGSSDVESFAYDKEAVVWGDNHGKGTTTISNNETCDDFKAIFNRRWFLHKVSNGDRPVPVIIGLQNNSTNNLGEEPTTDAAAAILYSVIHKSNDFVMIVADDSTALIPGHANYGNFKAVIPMIWLNGEPQCAYTLLEEGSYITFGYTSNGGNGCAANEDAQFTGAKKFSWTQWTSNTNTSSAAGLTLTVNTPVNLGDNIQVTQTKAAYPAAVRANRGYPRSVNTPANGSLRVQRRGGAIEQDVVVTITFNHPVIPEFSISDLDCYSRSFEEVEITGECSGDVYAPTLGYAGRQNQARYEILGNKAIVNKRGSVRPNDKNGMLNVAFRGGVTSVTIKYRTTGKTTSVTQEIYISPITLRSVPPPPTINKDGLSFVKQVKERDITTCDPVEYAFYIGNTNCDPVTVNFNDILPEKMKWEIGSFGLDAVSSGNNPSFNPQINPATSGNGEELQIDGLIVPAKTILELRATALLDEDAPSTVYNNRASITYTIMENNTPVPKPPLYSEDRETKDPYTSFRATWQQRKDEVVMNPVYSPAVYRADGEIEVTYTVSNTNADITDMYLNVDFNEEFAYVAGSCQITQVSGSAVAPVPVFVASGPDDSPNTLSIAGASNGSVGFVLPTGVMQIKFRLKAPPLSGIMDELDDNDQPTGRKVDLDIIYDFTSGMADPCLQGAVKGLQGNKLIPYSAITHIITNKNMSARILK